MLSENIRKKRRYCDLSQEKLAEKARVSSTTISLIETGKVIPNFYTFLEIIKNIDYDTFQYLKSKGYN